MTSLLDSIWFHLHNPARGEVLAGLAAVSGSAMHWGLFMNGEWHIAAPQIVVAHAIATAALFARLSAQEVAIVCGSYYLTLFTSILLYRVFFHRLSRAGFPGPVGYRMSKIWHMWKCRGSQNHRILGDLNKRYGDFVRTGPSEITVFHPDIFMAVDGPRTECIKAEWYDLLHPSLSLVTTRDKLLHAGRRRQWNKGFNPKAMAQYERRFLTFIEQLDVCIEADIAAGNETNVTDVFSWFTFDAMGSFVFNKSFDMLRDQKWHNVIVVLRKALSLLGPFTPVPWLVQIGFKLFWTVGPIRDWFDTIAWCEKQMMERVALPEDKTIEPDVAHYLVEDFKNNPKSKDSWNWLSGDALLAIVAGSEPTSATLVGLFHHLARSPHYAERIYNEVRDVDRTNVNQLSKLPYLEACIQEALRLFPAPPTGGNRKTSKNGMTIAGVYIPPLTVIVAPKFCISQRDDCFVRGTEFVPERWTDQPELVLNRAAYAPFGTGSSSCLGRALAVSEMRLVVANLIYKYKFKFAPHQSHDGVVEEMRDQFTPLPGTLRLVFERRG